MHKKCLYIKTFSENIKNSIIFDYTIFNHKKRRKLTAKKSHFFQMLDFE